MSRKSGFTIVELLAVVAILVVLLGLVGTAAAAAIRNAREKRADALVLAWKNAITSYYAQKGEWPTAIESAAKSKRDQIVKLNANEVNSVFQDVVNEALKKNNSLIDTSILFVCLKKNAQGCDDVHKHCNCPSAMEFTKALAMKKDVNGLAFGYPGVNKGKFRRFSISYNTQTDSISVSR